MDSKMIVAKVDSTGQVTIPREIRDYLNVELGGSIAFVKNEDGTARICLPAIAALDIAREAFLADPAVQAEGLETVEDVVRMLKEMRENGEL